MNYFELFELPVSIRIDPALLSRKYIELQKKYHPDFFVKANEREQEEALEKSSQLNRAFKLFKDEDETIKYILQLKGIMEEDEKYQLPPDFLTEMMELNEDLGTGSAVEITAMQEQLQDEVKDILENYNDGTVSEGELKKLKEYYYKKKYLRRILDRLEG
jgi:molecular chaperone HscB